jgi:hypothetical protein
VTRPAEQRRLPVHEQAQQQQGRGREHRAVDAAHRQPDRAETGDEPARQLDHDGGHDGDGRKVVEEYRQRGAPHRWILVSRVGNI